jgi:hypothetical protein
MVLLTKQLCAVFFAPQAAARASTAMHPEGLHYENQLKPKRTANKTNTKTAKTINV